MAWTRYTVSEEAWEVMLQDINAARHSIECESYILKSDTLGDAFIAAFRKKAREGVRVRILCDAVGSYMFFRSRLPDALHAEGIEVRFFNPIRAWRIHTFTSWFFRDHRKLLIIDAGVAYTGGVGLREAMRGWRDTHLKIDGPVVGTMRAAFEHIWKQVGTKYARLKRYPDVQPPVQPTPDFDFLESAPIIRSRRIRRQNFVYRNFLDAIKDARSYIYLTTPYFIPPLRLLRMLRAAARRRVDVRILVPWTSDHTWIDSAVHSYFGLLLRAGIRVFAYEKTMLHAKTGVIDDRWGSIGSGNLDNLSFFFNYEGNVVTSNRDLIQTLKDDFMHDCADAREIHRAEWRSRSFFAKLKELMTWPLHSFF